MAAPEFKILCIDDEPAILENYEAMISDLGYDAIKCTDASKALQLIEANRSTLILVISDQKMPGLEGTGIRAAMLAQFQDIPFIIVSGFVSRELALEAVNLKIAAFLEKPVRHQDLAACIEREGKNRLESLQERKILEKTFLEEANSLLEEVEPLILTLETDPHDKDAVNAIFRLVHTVKGSSGVLEAEHLTRFAHSFEDLISQLKMGEVIASKEVVSKMLFGLDVLKDMLASYSTRSGKQFNVEDLVLRLKPDGGTAAKSPPDKGDSPRLETTAKKAPRDSLEVPTAMLDEVMALGGEITVIRNMVNKLVRSIEKANPGNRDVALLTELLDEMHKINGAIQTKIVDLRKVPIRNVFRALPRTVRDLSTSLKKDIALQIVGDSLRVDTTLAQALANSIVHLVRNAADHGLETTEERLRLGKHKNGHVTITCTEDSENIRVKMIDDGRGLNLDRIKKKAAEQGLYSQDEITNMSRQRIMSFIFESGFSTAAKVTDVSGRGVGMDMVRSSIEAVGGKIDIDSEEGKGATFSLVLPIPRSVLIIDSLLVEISGHTLAIPQDSILRLLMLEKSEIAEQVSSVEGSRGPAYVLRTQEDIIPVIDLVDVLQLTTTSEAKSGLTEQLNLIIVKSGELKAALRVDQILDAEEIVVKPLHNTIEKLGVYGGATFMGDGRIGLILNVEKIISNLNASSALTEASRNLDATPLESDINLVKPASEYLIFTLDARGNYAMKLADVFRLEEIPIGNFSIVGDQETLIYRNQVIPIIDVVDKLRLERPTKVENTPEKTERCLIIVRFDEQIFGLVIESIKDVKSSNREVSTDVVCRSGIEGILILDNMTLTLISPVDVLKLAGYDVSPVNPEISQGQIQTIDANIVTAAAVAALAPAVEIAQKVPFDMSAGFGFFD